MARAKQKKPPARRVVLVGLDGCGKTANLKLLKEDPAFFSYQFVWARWKPFLLKPAYWLLNKKLSQNAPSSQVAARSALKSRLFKNSLLRPIWLGLALLDYTLLFYLKAAPFLLRQKPIIFDRFYQDLFIDQGLNFGLTPDQISCKISRYSWLFPAIDLFVYLKTAPGICFQRKDDIPDMNYLYLREAVYEHLADAGHWSVLDGSRSLTSVNTSLKQLIKPVRAE